MDDWGSIGTGPPRKGTSFPRLVCVGSTGPGTETGAQLSDRCSAPETRRSGIVTSTKPTTTTFTGTAEME